MIDQGKTFYGSNMRNLISGVVTNHTKSSLLTFHESAFMKALADLDVPKDFVKNLNPLKLIEVYKNKNTNNDPSREGEEEKMVALILSASLDFLLYSIIFFLFLIYVFACSNVGHTNQIM